MLKQALAILAISTAALVAATTTESKAEVKADVTTTESKVEEKAATTAEAVTATTAEAVTAPVDDKKAATEVVAGAKEEKEEKK